MTAHALLGASSSKRWLTCTPSARLCETMPEETTTFAAEGTLAHEIAELKLRKAYLEPMSTRQFNATMKKLQASPLFTPDMPGYVDRYVDYVATIVHGRSSPPFVAVEKRLDYSDWAPEGFGTGDCVILSGRELWVNDLKYGKGVPVSAEGNTQMRLYALGALREFGCIYPIETVHMAIVQPRLDDISEDTIQAADLLAWGETIKPRAQKAWAGEGEYVPGEHCRFCRARKICRARTESHTALEDFGFKRTPLLSDTEVAQILTRAANLESWVHDLREYALQALLRGAEIPGWKAVEGRSTRKFTSTDKAFATLQANGYDESLLFNREPLSVAAIETLIGKKLYRELLDGYVARQPGKPTLAPQSDKRDAIDPSSAQHDFKEEISHVDA